MVLMFKNWLNYYDLYFLKNNLPAGLVLIYFINQRNFKFNGEDCILIWTFFKFEFFSEFLILKSHELRKIKIGITSHFVAFCSNNEQGKLTLFFLKTFTIFPMKFTSKCQNLIENGNTFFNLGFTFSF